jgi:hypothetical protein
MKNLWTQHLKKAVPLKGERGTSFVNTLHSLAGDGGKGMSGHCHRIDGSQRSKSKVSYTDDGSITARTSCSQSPVDRALSRNACTELCRWTAKSQSGHEMGVDAPEEDHVQLLTSESGQLTLRYNVTGEDVFEIEVGSLEEAENVIYEDNMTTARLYPDISDFQWSKK